MVVDLVLETRVTTGVCTLLPLQNDRATVRHDQPGPHQQYPRLAERDLAVIDPDQASPLGDQKGAAGWGVIDIFSDLRGDRSETLTEITLPSVRSIRSNHSTEPTGSSRLCRWKGRTSFR